MAKHARGPGWAYVDDAIGRVEERLGRQLVAETEDGALVAAELEKAHADGDDGAGVGRSVASAEGCRRRIYVRNHQETGTARWFDRQGRVFKQTGQFPLTVRAPRPQPGGGFALTEVPSVLLTAEEMAAWIGQRARHIAGESVNLDAYRWMYEDWQTSYPQARTLGDYLRLSGRDLLDLRFDAEA